MTGNGTQMTGEQLALRSQLSELARIPAWIERLASQHGIPDKIQFAMNLCLEEALSNVIRHGYSGNPDHSMLVQFGKPRENYFVIVVEDEALPFNPVDAPELPALEALDESRVGGQGIRLLRRFASTLDYERTAAGNRLRMGFLANESAAIEK